MSDVEPSMAPAEGALQPPWQRQAGRMPAPHAVTNAPVPVPPSLPQPVPQQRTPDGPHEPRRFDVYGNPISTTPPVLILQNTTYTSGRAMASMALGLLSLVVGGPLVGVPAMLLSSSADKQIARSRGKIGGSASARIGFWSGLAGSLLGIFTFYMLLALFGFSVSVPLPGS
jgi:hypothetical protein